MKFNQRRLILMHLKSQKEKELKAQKEIELEALAESIGITVGELRKLQQQAEMDRESFTNFISLPLAFCLIILVAYLADKIQR